MLLVEGADLLPLGGLDPMIAGHQRVVLVGLAVALPPVEELPPGNTDPANEAVGGDFGLVRPRANEVDDLVARVVRDPAALQGSPEVFFNFTYSSEISAITASFLASFASCWATRASSSAMRACSRCSWLEAPFLPPPSNTLAAFSKSWRCQL